MCLLAIEKRALIAYNDKRVLLDGLVNGQPNSNLHAYGNYSLVDEVYFEKNAEPAAASNNLHTVSSEQCHNAWLKRAHALAVKKARRRNPDVNLEVNMAKI